MERGECEKTVRTETNCLCRAIISPQACKHKSEAVHFINKQLSNYSNAYSPSILLKPTLLVNRRVFLVFISHVTSSRPVFSRPVLGANLITCSGEWSVSGTHAGHVRRVGCYLKSRAAQGRLMAPCPLGRLLSRCKLTDLSAALDNPGTFPPL